VNILCLEYERIAPNLCYHTAYQTFGTGEHRGFSLHSHDFWEIFLVLSGKAEHVLGDTVRTLETGDLCLIRPNDTHALETNGTELHLVNVAFPVSRLFAFLEATELHMALEHWNSFQGLLNVRLSGQSFEHLRIVFLSALRHFIQAPNALELCRFLTETLPMLETDSALFPTTREPAWLREICASLENPEHLRDGVKGLLERTRVSPEHLSRSFRRHLGQTPTEFVNEVRLSKAALMLLSSHEDILELASECGFENASYFYRCFKRRFGLTPLVYRKQGQAPLSIYLSERTLEF
jgi:AraC-like DNA-binding protein/mannose-6-phosphate isomerase-like protein (cupin superfamily)